MFGRLLRKVPICSQLPAVQHVVTPMKQFSTAKIVYTLTDEAPMLATYSLLPVIQRFAKPKGIKVELSDISVAARVLANFSDCLTEEQQMNDELADLGELSKTPEGNIIKLPNISASVPQLLECISELQSKGYNVPNYNPEPQTDEEKANFDRYAKVLGSAVNPVLREGNSDRRAAAPVKKNAQAVKRRMPRMRDWKDNSASCVSHMSSGDFFGSEQSHIMPEAGSVSITLHTSSGKTVLKEGLALEKDEVIDATCMNVKALCEFFEKEISDCHDKGLMMSLHMKATMMKVSDPIIFGHCVKVYYKSVFAKYADLFKELNVNANNGIGDVYDKIKGHPKQQQIEADLMDVYKSRPGLAMVNSHKGITNLHVPSDVIIDASMPNVVRDGGMMWNVNDGLEDVKCIIPDRSYAPAYGAIIDDCKVNGQFDWTTMGHVSNVGLMAKKAEEYGSHDKTFEIPADGEVTVSCDATGTVLFKHSVNTGDIWRMCQTKDEAIKDWVKLAVTRARASGDKAIFWLDPERPHDCNLRGLAFKYLQDHDTNGLHIGFASPSEAMHESCARARAGKDTISVTGNVLRDYLTDLFPILELGTSAKMLSIVPLLAGGVLLETGAGGSAPKHVQQFVEENHLRWDSLGEYLATAIGFQELGARINSSDSTVLGDTFMEGIGKWLELNRTPGRKGGEPDNRAANFYVALYWAEAMAKHDSSYAELHKSLAANEETIIKDLVDCQGPPQDIGGYYMPEVEKVSAAMRPSKVFNDIIDNY